MDQQSEFSRGLDDIYEIAMRPIGAPVPGRRNQVSYQEDRQPPRRTGRYRSGPQGLRSDLFPTVRHLAEHDEEFAGNMNLWEQHIGDHFDSNLHLRNIYRVGPGHSCLVTTVEPAADIRARSRELRGHNPLSQDHWHHLHAQQGTKDYSLCTYNLPPLHRMPAEFVARMLDSGHLPDGDLAQATERQLSEALARFMSTLSPSTRSDWVGKRLDQDQILQHKILSMPFSRKDFRPLCYFDQKEEDLIIKGGIYDAPMAGWVEPAVIPDRLCRTCQGPSSVAIESCHHNYCVPHFRAKVVEALERGQPMVCCERSYECVKPDFVFANAGWAAMYHLYHFKYAMAALGEDRLFRCTNRNCNRFVGVKADECRAVHCPFCWELTCLGCGFNHETDVGQPSAAQASSTSGRETLIPQFLDKELVGQNKPLLDRLSREGRYHPWDHYGLWEA